MSNNININKAMGTTKESQEKTAKILDDLQKKVCDAINIGLSSGLPEASLKMIEDIISSIEKIDSSLASKLEDKLKGIVNQLQESSFSDKLPNNKDLQDEVKNIFSRNDLQSSLFLSEIEKTNKNEDYDPFKTEGFISISL